MQEVHQDGSVGDLLELLRGQETKQIADAVRRPSVSHVVVSNLETGERLFVAYRPRNWREKRRRKRKIAKASRRINR